MNRASSLAMRHFVAVASVIVLAAPSAHADDLKPTREAFLKEVLDAKPSPVTPKFDDYTSGSYHIEKEDLLKGLVEWLQGVHDAGTLNEKVLKAPDGKGKKEAPNSFASEVLLVTWSKDGKTRRIFHEKEGMKLDKVFDQYSVVLKELKKTYPAKDK
jgi:hypothetical protein